MERIASVILIALALSSCGLSKEMRRSNRAADLIEKAKRIDPSAVEGREVDIPVALIAPERSGSFRFEIENTLNTDSLIEIIETEPDEAPRIIREIVEMPCDTDSLPFEDDNLKGTFSITDGVVSFDYTEKADTVSGTVKAMTDSINPTNYERRPPTFWERLGDKFTLIIVLVIGIVIGVILKKFILP